MRDELANISKEQKLEEPEGRIIIGRIILTSFG